MMTVARPVTASRPAVTAVWWPKLRERQRTTTRGSAAWMARRRMAVRSLEPSST